EPADPQRAVAHPTARNPRSSRKSLYSHLREKFLGRRHLLQTTIFLVALGSLGSFLGTRIRPATAQPSAVLPVDSASSVAARGLEPRSVQQARSVSSGVLSPNAPQTRTGESSLRHFTYVIQPTGTVQHLC